MLNPTGLEQQIKTALEQYLPETFEQASKVLFPKSGEEADNRCKEFGQTVADLLSEPLASSLAGAIDYYVKNISITGTIVTTGSPVTQQAPVVPAPTPTVAGVIPNTLKVQ